MRKKLSVLCTTFLLPLLMTVLAFAADSPFSDVAPDAPYAESIAYLVEHGITNGTGADTFSPDAPVTVRQWSVMLCRAYGLPIEGDTWEEMSYVAIVEAYSHGWMYSSIFSAPETQMCRAHSMTVPLPPQVSPFTTTLSTITTKELIVGASGIEVGENCAEHFGRDLSAALTERRRGSLNARIVQNLS